MNSSFQSLGSFCVVVICGIFLGLSSCENPGSVGSNLGGEGAEIVSDTIEIDGVEAIHPNSYSGELSFFSAGKYEDPLFGTMTARGFLKPGLPAGTDSIEAGANMLLRIILNGSQVYGDSLANQEYSLYEVDELWRARAMKINDDIDINTNKKIGSFTLGAEDSIDVALDSLWVDEYRQFADSSNADSLYKYEVFGLAMVPENGEKIIPLNTTSTRFVVQNPEADTFDVALNQWGYTLDRDTSNVSMPQGSVPLYSTYESVIHFGDLGVSEIDIQASGLSRAELVFYQNTSTMQQSLQNEPFSVARPTESTVYLHLANPDNVPENIDPGVPVDNLFRIQGSYSSNTGAYRFDITRLVENIIRNGFPEGREFFMTLPNDGIIKPGLIYTDSDQVPADKKPKIIITSLKNSNS